MSGATVVVDKTALDLWSLDEAQRRVPTRIPIAVETAGGAPPIAGVVANISLKGVFVATSTPAPVDAVVRLSLSLPEPWGPHRLSVLGRVRWVNDAAAPAAPALPGGMGVAFVSLPPHARARVGAFVRRCIERADHPGEVARPSGRPEAPAS